MSLTALHNLTIRKYLDGLRKKEFSALEMLQAHFARIAEKNPELNAFLSVHEEQATRAAEAADIAVAKGEPLSPLAGAPVAIKDNLLIEGLPATAGSKILEHYTASYDAHVIEKLKAAGAAFVGKTNLDEFAMGSSTENSAFGPVKNPHDTTRVPGGSSGGSAAAVAAHLALGALGTDTGGSIRQPAALCGVVGLKPTYGAVSRSGAIALASSLDQIGPFAKTVEDTALLFDVIRGYDPMDATSVDHAYDTDELMKPKLEDMKRLVVGLPDEYFVDGLDDEVAGSIAEAVRALESLGVRFAKISLPHTKYALSCYYIVLPAEASSNLARFDGIRYARLPDLHRHPRVEAESDLANIYLKQKGRGYGPEPKRRIILGTFVLSSGYYDAYYDKAQRVRALVKRDFDEAFRNVDVILAPTSPTTAFKIGAKANDPLAMYLSDIFTIPVNLAGLPGISLPVREKRSGLPVGFQLIGRHFREADILGLGRYYEKIHGI